MLLLCRLEIIDWFHHVDNVHGVTDDIQDIIKGFTDHFGIRSLPKMGEFIEFTVGTRQLRLYRMPSSSRAYPMAVEKKAEYYRKMFEEIL